MAIEGHSSESTPSVINGTVDHIEVFVHSEEEQRQDEQEHIDPDTTADTATADVATTSMWRVWWKHFVAIYWKNEFLFLVVVALCLAKAYPPLGAVYLAPQYTSSWIAVIIIFFFSGLGLRTEAFQNAITRVRFNLFVQCYNFGVVSGLVFGISRAVAELGIISKPLADGVVMASCLSMSVNMVAILTRACNGDEAAAVFNQALGNMTGVFLSPALILGYLGLFPGISLGKVFYELALRIVLPVIAGQLLQKTSHYVSNLGKKYRAQFKHIQEYSLIFIIYCTFCKVFIKGEQQSLGQVFAMVFYQLLQLLFLMAIAWYLLRFFWRDEPSLRVMGLFGCTHKTISLGVPLITAIYGDDPHLGQFILPILIWHPMQLIVGTLLTPHLSNFIIKEKERLGIVDDEDENENVIKEAQSADATSIGASDDSNDDEEAQNADTTSFEASDGDNDDNGSEVYA